MGIEAVPAQGRMWGLFSPQTGVDTPIGAPKLELLSQRIRERAQKLGIDPAKLRDDVLTGKAHASWLIPALAAGPGMLGTGRGAVIFSSRRRSRMWGLFSSSSSQATMIMPCSIDHTVPA